MNWRWLLGVLADYAEFVLYPTGGSASLAFALGLVDEVAALARSYRTATVICLVLGLVVYALARSL